MIRKNTALFIHVLSCAHTYGTGSTSIGFQFREIIAEIKGGKVVLRFFRPADHLHFTVFLQQQFRASQLAVVVIAHGKTVSAGIVDK